MSYNYLHQLIFFFLFFLSFFLLPSIIVCEDSLEEFLWSLCSGSSFGYCWQSVLLPTKDNVALSFHFKVIYSFTALPVYSYFFSPFFNPRFPQTGRNTLQYCKEAANWLRTLLPALSKCLRSITFMVCAPPLLQTLLLLSPLFLQVSGWMGEV